MLVNVVISNHTSRFRLNNVQVLYNTKRRLGDESIDTT